MKTNKIIKHKTHKKYLARIRKTKIKNNTRVSKRHIQDGGLFGLFDNNVKFKFDDMGEFDVDIGLKHPMVFSINKNNNNNKNEINNFLNKFYQIDNIINFSCADDITECKKYIETEMDYLKQNIIIFHTKYIIDNYKTIFEEILNNIITFYKDKKDTQQIDLDLVNYVTNTKNININEINTMITENIKNIKNITKEEIEKATNYVKKEMFNVDIDDNTTMRAFYYNGKIYNYFHMILFNKIIAIGDHEPILRKLVSILVELNTKLANTEYIKSTDIDNINNINNINKISDDIKTIITKFDNYINDTSIPKYQSIVWYSVLQDIIYFSDPKALLNNLDNILIKLNTLNINIKKTITEHKIYKNKPKAINAAIEDYKKFKACTEICFDGSTTNINIEADINNSNFCEQITRIIINTCNNINIELTNFKNLNFVLIINCASNSVNDFLNSVNELQKKNNKKIEVNTRN